jgi:hypothetical protein
MIFITITCDMCKWARVGDTSRNDDGNFDAVLRSAITHAEKEGHTLGVIGTVKPMIDSHGG